MREGVVHVLAEAGFDVVVTAGDAEDLVRKADSSPVTRADRAAHAVIAGDLAGWDPSVPVVSEEAAVAPWPVRREWPRFWLVDPLDGTKEFLAGSGEYTVNIALIEGHEPILGVVYAPATDVMYLAGRGLGAWR